MAKREKPMKDRPPTTPPRIGPRWDEDEEEEEPALGEPEADPEPPEPAFGDDREVDGRDTLVTYKSVRTRGVTELLPRYVTTSECCAGVRSGVLKKSWLYSVDVAVGERPLSWKEMGAPPSMVYWAEAALCGNSVGMKPIQLRDVPVKVLINSVREKGLEIGKNGPVKLNANSEPYVDVVLALVPNDPHPSPYTIAGSEKSTSTTLVPFPTEVPCGGVNCS